MILTEMLRRSAATPEFREAVDEFVTSGRTNDLLSVTGRCPPVKVERTLAKILEEFPALSIERVRISAESGCESFRGELTIEAAGTERRIDFYWDCRWRALQMGWTDCFGLPDQGRAAREFGHDCFRRWEQVSAQPAERPAIAGG